MGGYMATAKTDLWSTPDHVIEAIEQELQPPNLTQYVKHILTLMRMDLIKNGNHHSHTQIRPMAVCCSNGLEKL